MILFILGTFTLKHYKKKKEEIIVSNPKKDFLKMNQISRNLATNEPNNNTTNLQELIEKVEQLQKKIDGIEQNQKQPFVRILSLFNLSRLVTTEQRLKDGLTRFIERKRPCYGIEREIYANYVDYYDDIFKRMVVDQAYCYGNYAFLKTERPNSLCSIEKWPRDSSVIIAFHPKDEMKYLQLAYKERNWSTSNISGDYYQKENDKNYLLFCCIKTKYTWEDIGFAYFLLAVIIFAYIFYACSSIYFTLFPFAVTVPLLFMEPRNDDDIIGFLILSGIVGSIYMIFKVSLFYGIALFFILVTLIALIGKLKRR